MLLLFFPAFPKKFSYYSFFILVCNLLFPNYARLVFIASYLAFRIQWSECSIRVFERSIRVYRSFSGFSAHYLFSCASYITFLTAQLFLLANQGKACHQLFQWLSDYSLITILLFRNYFQKIGDLLIPKLFRHNRRKSNYKMCLKNFVYVHYTVNK